MSNWSEIEKLLARLRNTSVEQMVDSVMSAEEEWVATAQQYLDALRDQEQEVHNALQRCLSSRTTATATGHQSTPAIAIWRNLAAYMQMQSNAIVETQREVRSLSHQTDRLQSALAHRANDLARGRKHEIDARTQLERVDMLIELTQLRARLAEPPPNVLPANPCVSVIASTFGACGIASVAVSGVASAMQLSATSSLISPKVLAATPLTATDAMACVTTISSIAASSIAAGTFGTFAGPQPTAASKAGDIPFPVCSADPAAGNATNASCKMVGSIGRFADQAAAGCVSLFRRGCLSEVRAILTDPAPPDIWTANPFDHLLFGGRVKHSKLHNNKIAPDGTQVTNEKTTLAIRESFAASDLTSVDAASRAFFESNPVGSLNAMSSRSHSMF
jgi:hypothetical protein